MTLCILSESWYSDNGRFGGANTRGTLSSLALVLPKVTPSSMNSLRSGGGNVELRCGYVLAIVRVDYTSGKHGRDKYSVWLLYFPDRLNERPVCN